MADLFGEWVPDEWIQEVFAACERAPQHRYLFLTKNPRRYVDVIKYFPKAEIWLGSTVTTRDDEPLTRGIFWNTFVSVEPILGDVLHNCVDGNMPNWVIIGAETGKRKDKIIPKREWVDNIVNACRAAKVPLFMKDSLRELMGDDFVQEYPWQEEAK